MNSPIHNELFHCFADLFAQLGLPSDSHSIATFIGLHAPLADELDLPDAPFWTPAQASFLREAISEDADWAELVDDLNASLRARH